MSSNINEQDNGTTTDKVNYKGIYISGIFLVLAAIIGIFSYDLNKNTISVSEYESLLLQFTALQEKHAILENEYNNISSEMPNDAQIKELEAIISKYEKEIDRLNSEISVLYASDSDLSKQIQVSGTEASDTSASATDSSANLDSKEAAINTDSSSKIHSVNLWNMNYFTVNNGYSVIKDRLDDNYGNKHYNVLISVEHGSIEKNFLLNSEYSRLEGTIFKSFEERGSSINPWIRITCDDRSPEYYEVGIEENPIFFSVDLSGVRVVAIELYTSFAGALETSVYGGISNLVVYKK